MVYYRLKENTERYLIYEYFPEEKLELNPGIITYDKFNDTIELTTPAEKDPKHYVKATDSYWHPFGGHAMNGISRDYAAGIIKQQGMVAWY
jgi:hypothetical protein